MKDLAGRIIEATLTAILTYLIIANGKTFAAVVSSIGTVYVDAVHALQGK